VPYEKDFDWMACWQMDPEVLGSPRLKASAFGGKSLWLKASVIGKGGRAPVELCPSGCLITEGKHRKPQSQLPSPWRLLAAPTWLSFEGQSRLAC
jgi:hypothetical protein